MTEQPEADDRGYEAAEDVAALGIHTEELPTRWLPADPEDTTPMGCGLTWHAWSPRSPRSRSRSAEAGRAEVRGMAGRNPGGLYAVITDDLRELWHELEMAARWRGRPAASISADKSRQRGPLARMPAVRAVAREPEPGTQALQRRRPSRHSREPSLWTLSASLVLQWRT